MRRSHAGAVAVAGVLFGTSTCAQQSSIEFGLGSRLSWTSNASLGNASGQEDTILELRPRVTLRREGAGLTLNGSAGLNAVGYARGTQDSRVRPEADLAARLVAVDRLLFVEAGYSAAQASADPFGARPDAGAPASSSNSSTTTQVRLSPVIEATAGNRVRYGLRSDNTWTREIDADPSVPSSRGYFGRHSAHVERAAEPLGWKVYAERSRTRFTEGDEPEVTAELVRLTLQYAIDVDWVAGVRAGSERNDALAEDPRRSFAGAELRWHPSPRTTVAMSADGRFFGTAWSLAFTHRSPRIAWNVSSSRDVQSTLQSVFEFPAGANVTSLLDAMFTTRYPDPAERARVVQEFMSRQGLPGSTLNPIGLNGQRFSLVTRHAASVGFIGLRSSVAFSGYRVVTRDVPDSLVLATGAAANNNAQHGLGVTLSHQFTPRVSMNVSSDWSRIRALEGDGGDQTTQRDLRVQLSLLAAQKTSVVVGGRYRKLDSTVAVDGREGLVFVGMDHRF